MWLLISFIVIWAISPGPVAVMTLHEARKNGRIAGIAVVSGATLTAGLMVVMGLFLHIAGFSTILESDNMDLIEQVGAFGIISMGVYAGYKSLWANSTERTSNTPETNTNLGFVQGMMVMATYIPQALIFYTVIVPQTVEAQTIITTIIILGTLKTALIFGWHAAIAVMVTRTRIWTGSNRFGRFFEVVSACLLMVLGLNILL